jgi:HK97 family phage major capsid protein
MELQKAEVSGYIADALKAAGLEDVVDKINDLMAKASEKPTPAAAEEKAMEKTEKVGRLMRALAAHKGDAGKAANWVRKNWQSESIAKALEAGDEAAGGFLIRDEMAEGLIELLYPKSVVRASGARSLPIDSGTLRLPKVTAGVSGGWIGEGENVPLTQPAFGQLVLTAKKYAALVPMSNDLLRRDSIQADRFVRDDLVRDIALSTDLAFIRADGTNGQPKGLRYWGVATASQATVDLDKATQDLVNMLKRMGNANVGMTDLGWLMDWGTWSYLISLRDSNGNFAWKPEMDGGTLLGAPFRLTSQIPRNLGGASDESELYLVDFSETIIGETTSILIDASDTAAYYDGSNVQASFSLDQTVIRAIIEVDFGVRHADAVQILTDIKDWTL